jgi:nucleoside-diphosphate-sugar epimerase
MRILFTGASSFTGLWFVRELAAAGHEVTATFTRTENGYDGIRAQRMSLLPDACRRVYSTSFGTDEFITLIRDSGPWDLLCHHGAEVTDYKSPDFDPVGALRHNTLNLRAVLEALKATGGGSVLLTGSVFEQNEGSGADDQRAFSPYGLSKGLTWEVFRHYCREQGTTLGKFVIPNPFGPYAEPKFTEYLIRSWYEGKTPSVQTPAYVRDNIHVSLLAKEYAAFAATIKNGEAVQKLNPSGYAETQGAFAQRFAREMSARLSIDCPLELMEQTEFQEPRERVNTDTPDAAKLGWDEQQAWDELAEYYKETYGKK